MKKNVIKINQFDDDKLYRNEWLITNGIGGFACGSISGTPMRKYHSLLNAALSNPYGRTIMLNYVADRVVLPDKTKVTLSCLQRQPKNQLDAACPVEFRLENGLPVWIYDIQGVIIEKSLLLIHHQNTLHMSYKLQSPHEGIEIQWQPFLHFRANEQPVDREIPNESYTVHAKGSQYEIECPGFPPLKLFDVSKLPFTVTTEIIPNVFYEIEAERGYASSGTLTSPGFYSSHLLPKKRTTFIASTESWETIFALSPEEAWCTENMRKKNLLKVVKHFDQSSLAPMLTLAADQFLIKPMTRFEELVRLEASGEEVKSIIAGFPWFTDWGRDTMISLEGLTLATGRYREAYSILHTFAHYIQEGLIPNMFPDGQDKGLYNTADATLWFFHAIDRYISVTGDEDILEFLLPKIEGIIRCHIQGTRFGIKMDDDGLLHQGYPETQLTWMDAKVGNYVVTPRRGKAVEINGLWYNALRLYEKWADKSPDLSQRCYESFNKKFWFEEEKHLYDVIEGEEGNNASLRPNQLFSISLRYPVLQEDRWKMVLDSVQKHLYTPVGLRTLAPYHADYKEQYDGDLETRDAAYHQGSVWPWLLGPYIDVWLKVYPGDLKSVNEILSRLEPHILSSCVGTIGEIFDASPPYKPRGCFAQAWSVAEFLRCLMKTKV